MSKISSGIHTSPIIGKLLKARPASFPATKAPGDSGGGGGGEGKGVRVGVGG